MGSEAIPNTDNGKGQVPTCLKHREPAGGELSFPLPLRLGGGSRKGSFESDLAQILLPSIKSLSASVFLSLNGGVGYAK